MYVKHWATQYMTESLSMMATTLYSVMNATVAHEVNRIVIDKVRTKFCVLIDLISELNVFLSRSFNFCRSARKVLK